MAQNCKKITKFLLKSCENNITRDGTWLENVKIVQDALNFTKNC